jgi:hypothetical protein
VRLDQSLVLNRFLHGLLGADRLRDLALELASQEEGPAGDGQTHFFHLLAGRRGLRIPEGLLSEYDRRIVGCEARLSRARGGLSFKYFQYLALLCTEIYLDRPTTDPETFCRELNAYAVGPGAPSAALHPMRPYAQSDLRRMA